MLLELGQFQSQEELADLAGIERGTLNRALNGRRKLHQHTYTKIMQALQTRVVFTVVWFLHGEGEPPGSVGRRAVEEYLTSPAGVDASEELKAELRALNWSALSAAHRTQKAIHRLRKAIESNLRLP